MAAPPEITMSDLSGTWIMNKTHSTSPDAILALQGVPWLKRRAISWATVYLSVKQYIESSITHIDIDQTATGGIKGTTELRALDWQERSHSDPLFGDVRGRNRWMENLKGETGGDGKQLDGWFAEAWEEGMERWVHGYVINDKAGWTAEQTWGFAKVDGVRYHVRRVIVKKGDKVEKGIFVYDWQGKEDQQA